ncbi:uncharacterized protein LOC126898540 [Daktulosphaira vitifoliae]|uniref:uncharacterized protein LOC126898540 n=1 Tax=Daktulosphaira vitifoliae TaxID=58002 RepID=UPI0021AA7316|nr:uncharacterized protein LOC126898540 [Daktulosphaira vitifoliae]XP_050528655.1 uncharacterized protein LOC126898540 [Daktulosphaira vitifoliae]
MMSLPTYDDSSSDSDTQGSQETYFCTYCQDEILRFSCRPETGYDSITIVVCCATCTDFYLCLMCFSSGAEIGLHKNYHDYKLITLSKPNFYSEKLLNAIEEWVSEDTEKLLGSNKKVVTSWKDVANVIGSKNPEEVKKDYMSSFIDGQLGQKVINLVNQRIGHPQVITLDQALAMGCFQNCTPYYPTKKILKIPANEDDLEQYKIEDEKEGTKPHCNQSMKLVNRYQWDSYQVQLLLQCTAEHGYGNWEEISKHFNRIVHDEYNSGERTYRTAREIKEEYLKRFIQTPLLIGTWSPTPSERPSIPDRTKRIEAPKSVEDMTNSTNNMIFANEETPSLFCLSSPIEEEKSPENQEKIEEEKSDEPKMEVTCCTYCQEEFPVIGYKQSEDRTSNYILLSIYTCCTNIETCKDFFICIMCLASGAEIGQHKKDHGYSLVSKVKNYCNDEFFPESDWTVIEELALLSALEEWHSEYTDKYLFKTKPDKLMIDWTSVSKHIQSKNPLEAKAEFENIITKGLACKYLQTYNRNDSLVSYEQAIQMDCFKKPKRIITITEDGVAMQEKYTWTKTQLIMLLDYTAIYGYGNWEKIAVEFNKNINYEHYGKVKNFIKRTPEEIKSEYVSKFIENPIRRGTWKLRSNARPVIADRTRFFKPHIQRMYPSIDLELFANSTYNHITDEYQHVYLDMAETILDDLCPQPIKKTILKEGEGKKKEVERKRDNNFDEDVALVCLQRYNDVLKTRQIAKGLVHSYRLMEQFLVYKDRPVMPKIKPFEERLFAEHLTNLALLMNVKTHTLLMVREKDEKLLMARFNELRLYRVMGITKFSEVDVFNTLRKCKGYLKQFTPLYTSAGCMPSNNYLTPAKSDGQGLMKYLQFVRTDYGTSQLRGKYPLRYLANDMCEELLTITEKMLCLKYNLYPNDYLKRKRKILNYGLGEDRSKVDHVIYKYLVKINKIDLRQSASMIV